MKKVFVDTNILVDLIADRPPFSKFAIELFEKAENNEAKLYTSSHSIATTHYLLKKHLPEKDLREIITSLLNLIELIPVDGNIVKKSLQSKHRDFEDAIQMFAAETINDMNFIVTRNLRDFKDANITVLPADELLKHL